MFQCEHCQKELAFAKFRLTKTLGPVVFKNLCADCGFNIVNFRKTRFVRKVDFVNMGNTTKTVEKEFIARSPVYTDCVLVEILPNTYELMIAYERAEAEEKAQAQQKARVARRAVSAPPTPMAVRKPRQVA